MNQMLISMFMVVGTLLSLISGLGLVLLTIKNIFDV